MSELLNEPAQTYQLNVVASALGRFASPHIDTESVRQATDMLGQTVDAMIQDPKPVVPHTNAVLLTEAATFDEKLHFQLASGRVNSLLPKKLLDLTMGIVEGHRENCIRLSEKSPQAEMLVDPSAIADAYGLSDLWTNAEATMREETMEWAPFGDHPQVPDDLKQSVDLEETKQLMRLMWRHVIRAPRTPEVNTYLTDDTGQYHVFWAPMADSLDYATPSNYDRATQLSFDLPHNATHLAHLDALQSGDGVFRYNDNMAQRAYFEAATVFSEYRTVQEAAGNKDFIHEMHDILKPTHLSPDELADWVVQDRGYEFKLRAARYAADVLMINGASFQDTTHEIADVLDIPLSDAEKETKKYLAWTGLGAVYSFGYRKLRDMGTENVADIFTDNQGRAVSSWTQKLSEA